MIIRVNLLMMTPRKENVQEYLNYLHKCGVKHPYVIEVTSGSRQIPIFCQVCQHPTETKRLKL